jgi:hypothetical protein
MNHTLMGFFVALIEWILTENDVDLRPSFAKSPEDENFQMLKV